MLKTRRRAPRRGGALRGSPGEWTSGNLPGGDGDRGSAARQPIALRAGIGEHVLAAGANLVLAGKVDIRRGPANLAGGVHQPMVESPASGLGRQVEIGGADDADIDILGCDR